MRRLAIISLFLLLAGACVQPKASTETRDLGINNSGSDQTLLETKILKIIKVSNHDIFLDHSMNVNDSVTLRAALFDLGGEFLGLAPASWSINSASFPSSNLSSLSGQSVTFTPTNIGTTKITAVYAGSDPKVSTLLDLTGDITVTNIQTPDSLLITAGDNQSAIVNNNLTSPLEVQVLDAFLMPIQGVEINFSVTSGSGSIIGLSNVFTDASGKASATVKLGTVSGSSNNTYRAYVVSDPTLYVDFSANALPGPPAMLTFTNSPGVSYAGLDFSAAPRVQVRDQFSNAIDLTTGAASVSLSVQIGSGNLIGTTTSQFANGIALFENVGYDTVESGVVLRATYGAINGDSVAFDIIGTPPGACVIEVPGEFITTSGGCHDLATGLTWSRGSSMTMTYYDAVWDASLTGASPADEHDYGRTNDYVTDGCEGTIHCDNGVSPNPTPSVISYCHDLVQGGYEDWRLPDQYELVTAILNANATGQPDVINFLTDDYYIVSTRYQTERSRVVYNTTAGVSHTLNTTPDSVICVRGNRSDLTKMRVTASPSEMRYGQIPSTALTVQLEQADGVRGNAQGVAITLSGITTGALNGTTTAYTNNKGVATFDSFNITGATPGTNTITISSADFPDITVDVDFFFAQKCTGTDAVNYVDADGGCKHIPSDLVWAKKSATSMNWQFAVHSSEINGEPGLSDIEPASNYCYDLVESGYSDWRLPTTSELQALASVDGYNNLENITVTGMWTSTSVVAGTVRMISLQTGGIWNLDPATGSQFALCVREP